MQAAFKRYSALLQHSKRGLSSASLADQRSLDWLRSSSLLTAAEYAALTARVKGSEAERGTQIFRDAHSCLHSYPNKDHNYGLLRYPMPFK